MNLDEFQEVLEDVIGAPLPSDERRLLSIMALDLPSWRDTASSSLLENMPGDRGPLVPGARERSFLRSLSEWLSTVLSSGSPTTVDLWRALTLAIIERPNSGRPSNHFKTNNNTPNKCGCGGDHPKLFKYLTFRSFSRFVPPPNGDPVGSKWGPDISVGTAFLTQLPHHERIVSIAPPSDFGYPTFLTSEAAAPHENLPDGVRIGTDEAARFAVKQLALPGLATSGDRAYAGGLLAMPMPEDFSACELFRPTVLEAMGGSTGCFAPGRPIQRHGETWPLTVDLTENDPANTTGIPEWVADVGGQFSCDGGIIVVGKFDDAE